MSVVYIVVPLIKITSYDPVEVPREAARIFKLWMKFPGNTTPHKAGGYLTILDRSAGWNELPYPMGTIPLDKAERWATLSVEKSVRLEQHPEHLTSYESRDTINDKWGGAIRALQTIFSFSGSDELGDETFALTVAERLGLITYDQALLIAQRSGNKLFSIFRDFVKRH